MINIGYIYKVTNMVNGKVYIGQTRRDIPTRWREHLYYATKHEGVFSLLYLAIRKYGEEAFQIEELEKCNTDLLDEREQFWINEFDSCNHGYNISLGGGGWLKSDDEEIITLWNDGLAVKEIGEKLSVHPETISRRLKAIGISNEEIKIRGNKKANRLRGKSVYQYDANGNFVAEHKSIAQAQKAIGGDRIKFKNGIGTYAVKGYQWRLFKADKVEPLPQREEKPKKVKPEKKERPRHNVCQFDLDGNYIATYATVKEASDKTGINKGGIQHTCTGLNRRAGNYQWRYVDEAERYGMKLNPISFIKGSIPVHQYTIDGDYIRSYESISEATKIFATHGTAGIRSVCEGRNRHAFGFRWSYEKVDKLPPIRADRSNRPVAKLDDSGNILKVYQTIEEAGKEHNRAACSIRSVCCGVHEKCAGYRWKFYETA